MPTETCSPRQYLPGQKPCPVCGETGWQDLYTVRDLIQEIPGTWTIVACPHCGLGIIDPLPDIREITSFYDDRFYTADGRRFLSGVERLRSLLAHRKAALVRKYLPQPGRILDFGAGPGHFGKVMSRRGWEVVNEDISYGFGKTRLRMQGDRPVLDYPDACFEAVTLWYVIEHLPNPQAALQEIARVLKGDGILIMAQQDFSSLQARFFGPDWLILEPPRHLYHFSPDNLAQLAGREGFNKIGLSRASLEIGPFTLLQSSLNRFLKNENYLFKCFKHRGLAPSPRKEAAGQGKKFHNLFSILLAPGLAPLALLAYYLLLWSGSGDIFTLILRKEAQP